MSNKLKSLGLALVAVFALSAVVASSASAAAAFTGDAGATITGAQVSGTITGSVKTGHEFTTKAGTIKCSTATFDGVATAAVSAEQTLAPTYSGCFLGGVVPVHVKMNGCDYLFKGDTTVSTSTITVKTDVVCSGGGPIIVEATGSTCVITIPAQAGLGGIEAHNAGTAGKMEIEATIDTTGIKYEVHGSCPNSPAQTTPFTDGSYRGVAKLHSSGASGVTVH